MLNFRKIKNLFLSNMVLRNPLCYYVRFCEAEKVKIENIKFDSERIIANQDGIHLAGYCKDFEIKDLYGEYGSPNDDFIALNADDSMSRQECFDSINGPIENIKVSNIHSDFCHCFVRILSFENEIKNVFLNNFSGSCKGVAVCLDAARGCRAPLLKDEDYPNGVGKIENITIKDFFVSHRDMNDPFICLESNCIIFRVENFENVGEKNSVMLNVSKTSPHKLEIVSNGTKTEYVTSQEEIKIISDKLDSTLFCSL